MKRSFGILILATTLVVGCGSQPGKKNADGEGLKSDKITDIKGRAMAPKKTVQTEYSDKPIHLTKAEFLAKVMDYEKNPSEWIYEGNLPCLIDFYADWCAPCKITAPILEDLAKEYAGKIQIYKVDVQKEQELANVFGIQGIPAFLYCPVQGDPSMTSGIARSPEDTKNMFRQNIENILLKNSSSSNLLE